MGSAGTRSLLHRGAAGEEMPPTPAVAKRGVSSCSWKVKSSIARLSARSEGGGDRRRRRMGDSEMEAKNEKYERDRKEDGGN